MNKPKVQGGVVVTGLVTGTHMIEDIKVAVPHKTAVHIPADVAFRSKDLWRALQQGRIFQLTGGSGLSVSPSSSPPIPPPAEVPGGQPKELTALRVENIRLQEELATARQQNKTLQEELSQMRQQLGDILGTLARLEKSGIAVTASGAVAPSASEAVGGEVPTYMPDLKDDSATANIQVEKQTAEGSSIEDAASRLKGLRNRNGS